MNRIRERLLIRYVINGSLMMYKFYSSPVLKSVFVYVFLYLQIYLVLVVVGIRIIWFRDFCKPRVKNVLCFLAFVF